MGMKMTAKKKAQVEKCIEFFKTLESILEGWLEGKETFDSLCHKAGVLPSRLRYFLRMYADGMGEHPNVPNDFKGRSVWGKNEYVYTSVFGKGQSVMDGLIKEKGYEAMERAVAVAILELPKAQRQAFTMRAKGFTFEQIGKATNVTRQGANINVKNAVKSLRMSDHAKYVLRNGVS